MAESNHMLKPKRLNQVAIAQATGVSRATVSLVLRGGEGAAADTKEKVLAAARRMGYRPNALVHSIRSGKSRTVGVLVHPYDSYWTNVLEGIHDRLIEAEHLPLVLWNNEHIKGDHGEDYAVKQIHRLLDRWVDGVILWPEFATLYGEHLREFERRNIPVVTIDHTVPKLTADTVECDEAQIASLAISHLAAHKHRSFLVVSGPVNVGWADARIELMLKEIENVPGASAEILRIPYNSNVSSLITPILQKKPAITAIVACTDHFASEAYKAASTVGKTIPQEISIMGVGNLAFSNILQPPLTTIEQDGYAVGQKAAQVELERGGGIISGPPKLYKVPVRLIKRESTADAP